MTDFGYGKITPIKQKSEAGHALKELMQDIGIPSEIHTDGATELTQGVWKQTGRYMGILKQRKTPHGKTEQKLR
jgi:hypothetical protein